MRYGYWLPVFGGWLRNVDDEGMDADVGLRQPARAAQRGDRLRPHARRRAEPQRHQGRRRAVARRVAHRRGARRRHRAAGAHGRGAADVPQPGDSSPSRPRTSTTSATAGSRSTSCRRGGRTRRAGTASHFEQHDDRYARTAEWLDVVDGVWTRADVHASAGSTTSVDETVLEPKPVRAAAPGDLRRRRVARRRRTLIAAHVRRLRHARRSAGAHRGEDRRHARAAARRLGLPPMHLRRRGVRDRPQHRRRGEARARRASPNVTPGLAGLRQLPAVDRGHAARAARVARGLLGVEPRPARRPRRHAGAGGRPRRARSRPPASICCCCSAARSSRRWSGSPSR